MEKNGLKIQKVIVRFAIIFFIVMLILLFFSKTVENMLLPAVTGYSPEEKRVFDSYKFNASISYDNINESYTFFDYFIESVLIEKNQNIQVGTPIAKLRDYDIKQKRNDFDEIIFNLENNVTQIEAALKKRMSKSDKEEMKKQLEMARKKLTDKHDEIDFYFSKIDSDNNLLSEVEGKVINVSMHDQSYVSITSAIFEYIDEDASLILEWSMPIDKIEKFNIDSNLNVEYTYNTQKDDGSFSEKTEVIDLPIHSIEFCNDSGNYNYNAVLNYSDHSNILLSPVIDLTLYSPSITIEHAVPKSALIEDPSSDNYYIFILQEDIINEELIVKEYLVEVINEYGFYCEINYEFSNNDQIVLSSTKPLHHNMKVKLR